MIETNKLKILAQKNLNPKIEEILKIETIEIDGEIIKTINGRKLHKWLDSRQEFANWIKNRIKKYEFIENKDYFKVDKIINRQTLKEFAISINTAKELSMIERNEKGKQARQYFIKCEETLKQIITKPKTLPELLMESAKALLEANAKVETLQPKAEVYDKLIDATGGSSITSFGKELGLGQKKIFWFIAEYHKHLYKLSPNSPWLPYQKQQDQGLYIAKSSEKMLYEKNIDFLQTLITPKGKAKVTALWNEYLKNEKDKCEKSITQSMVKKNNQQRGENNE